MHMHSKAFAIPYFDGSFHHMFRPPYLPGKDRFTHLKPYFTWNSFFFVSQNSFLF